MNRLLIAFSLILAAQASAIPQQINYQGWLARTDGSPLDTTVNVTFKIYTDPNGDSVWTETHACNVINGLFKAELGTYTPIPDQFNLNCYLGVTVGNDAEMLPRCQFLSVAHAYRVGTVDGASGGTIIGATSVDGVLSCTVLQLGNAINFSDGSSQNTAFDTTSLSNRINQKADSTDIATRSFVKSNGHLRGASNYVSPTGFVGGGDNNKADGDYSVIAGGGGTTASDSNSTSGLASAVGGGQRNHSLGWTATVGGGWGNNATDDRATVSGGISNTASGFGSTVAGGSSNTASGSRCTVAGGGFNSASNFMATVSGGFENLATGYGATVSGGEQDTASGDHATVSGGIGNKASGIEATVSGGLNNSADGLCSVAGGANNHARADYSVIAGGGSVGSNDSNSVHALADHSTISGGARNRCGNHSFATIAGGYSNSANGTYSFVAGGTGNQGGGDYSFAAGRGALAGGTHSGSFVWGSSSTGATTGSFNSNTVTFRCENGARFYTAASGTGTGISLAAGGGSWSSLSDSTQKENRTDVNTSEVLGKLNQLKISEWNYKSQDEKIRHMGPMAQDFSSAFGLGENNTTITTVDADGVMMAAIQELAQILHDVQDDNRGLQTRNLKLEEEVALQATRYDELRSLVQSLMAEKQQSSLTGKE